MGLEAKCEGRVGGRWQDGRARLEEKEIVFRGDKRVRAPLDLLKDVRVKDGVLAFRFGGEDLALRLGAQAAKWAERILHPPSRLDKLGVKPGQRVCVVGLDDAAFLKELTLRGAVVTSNRTVEGADMVFFSCPSRADLRRLPALARAIDPAGAIWVLWPKGVKEMREQDIRDVMNPPGLVDVKVVSFSDALSGLKLMIRRELRAMRTGPSPARRTGGLPPPRGFAPRPPRARSGAPSRAGQRAARKKGA
jgi:hypothetical protein